MDEPVLAMVPVRGGEDCLEDPGCDVDAVDDVAVTAGRCTC